jgi:hypothetical protein
LEGDSVVRHHRLFLRVPAVLGLIGLLVFVSGCPLTPDDSNSGPTETRFTARRNSVLGAIEWVAQSWAQKRFPEYQEILHDEFEFFIRDDDAVDLPWVTGDSWGRTDELRIAGNMFDESFDGLEDPVDTIEFDYTVIDTRDVLGPNQTVIGVLVTCDADVRVLVNADNGWLSNTRFEFLVVPDPADDTLFQVKEQREREVI